MLFNNVTNWIEVKNYHIGTSLVTSSAIAKDYTQSAALETLETKAVYKNSSLKKMPLWL